MGARGARLYCEPAVRRVPCRCTRRGEMVTGSLMGRATWSAACCTCQRPGGPLSRLPRVSGQAGAAASRQPGARTCVLWIWLSEALRSVAMCMRFTGLRTQRFPVSTAPAARRAADGHLVKCRGAQQVLTCSSLRTQLHLTCSRVTCPHPTLVPCRAARQTRYSTAAKCTSQRATPRRRRPSLAPLWPLHATGCCRWARGWWGRRTQRLRQPLRCAHAACASPAASTKLPRLLSATSPDLGWGVGC